MKLRCPVRPARLRYAYHSPCRVHRCRLSHLCALCVLSRPTPPAPRFPHPCHPCNPWSKGTPGTPPGTPPGTAKFAKNPGKMRLGTAVRLFSPSPGERESTPIFDLRLTIDDSSNQRFSGGTHAAHLLARLETRKTSEKQALARWHGCFPPRRGRERSATLTPPYSRCFHHPAVLPRSVVTQKNFVGNFVGLKHLDIVNTL
jgi:hypothetical protein